MGERDDNRRGRHQGIVVEIPCKGQSVGSAVRTTEGNSLGSSRMLIRSRRATSESGGGKQTIEATLELAMSKVINSVHGIPPGSESGAAAYQQNHAVRSPRSSTISVTR